jgi:D-beta-D-heptose 7-phosphate kinase/D-beta-D-heptose 1-phosphate adenosyltransferase
MVVLAVAVFGYVSYQQLPLNLMPDISYPTLTVRTEYPGAAPEEVENLISRNIEQRLGVVNNLVSLGARVQMVSVIGDDANGALLKDEMRQLGVGIEGIFSDTGRCTISKTRVIAVNQQVVRLDREARKPIDVQMEDELIAYINGHLDQVEAVLVSDYLKGIVTPRVLQAVIPQARRRKIPLVVDPKGSNYSKYAGATVITPNIKEAAQAAGVELDGEEEILSAAEKLLQSLKLQAALITRSKEGMSLLEKDKPMLSIPARAREVYDVSGAGDTVVAVLGLGLASKLSFAEAATLANIAAGIVVGKVGTATVTREEIVDYLAGEHHYSDNKVKPLEEVEHLVSLAKMEGKKIVVAFGCFDRLQLEQIKFLQGARRLGDLLVVGLWSDEVIRPQKGSRPPSISEEERAHIISALDCVSYVVVQNQDTLQDLLISLKPQVLAVAAGDEHPELERGLLEGSELELQRLSVD